MRYFAKHESGEVYVVDLEDNAPRYPVKAASGALDRSEYGRLHDFVVGRWAIDIEDFVLKEEHAEWAQTEFEARRLKIELGRP